MTKQTTLEGWQLVPVEPTGEMFAAMDDNFTDIGKWRDALAVAPAAPRTEPSEGWPSEEEIARVFENIAPKIRACYGPKPRCRDCADEMGICPSSLTPCDPDEYPDFLAGEFCKVLSALPRPRWPSEDDIARVIDPEAWGSEPVRGWATRRCEADEKARAVLRLLSALSRPPSEWGEQMKQDLRRLAIKKFHRTPAGVTTVRCGVCQGEWGEDAPEFHTATCTAQVEADNHSLTQEKSS